MRTAKRIELSDSERQQLELIASRPKSLQREALRAKIILECTTDKQNREIADDLNISAQTVGKWRNRFEAYRMDGMVDLPRSGAPRTISDKKVEEVLTKTLEGPPPNRTHWSRRRMAKETGIGQDSIGRIWRAFEIKPHIVKGFKISKDPMFVEKVRDIVGLYLSPPENAIVLSVDEKSQCQALERAQPILPMDIGQPESQTHDYFRHGTTSLFAAIEVATGKVTGKCFKRHRHQEFLKFLNLLNETYPEKEGEKLHLIVDNYGTHNTPTIKRWLLRHPRFELHFTPTGASWINQIERFFGLLTSQRIRRGSFKSVAALIKAIMAYIDEHNEDPKPFVWTKTADQIFEKLRSKLS